jgi:cytochrome c-type biogenesis protein CcmF
MKPKSVVFALMAWKRGDLLGVAQRLIGAAALALVVIAVTLIIAGVKAMLAPFMIGLAAFVMLGAVTDLIERTGLLRSPFNVAVNRLAGLPRSVFGTALAHFGLGMTVLGVVCVTQWGAERIATLKPAETVSLSGYELSYEGLTQRQVPNYSEQVAKFSVREGGAMIGVMEPSKRSFPARSTSISQAALMTRGFSQLYLSLGEPNADGSIALRFYHKPLVLLIWLGAVAMALGGALSLSDRRLRVGAPKPAKLATPRLQPAE